MLACDFYSFGPTLGQVVSFFSKSVLIMAGYQNVP